MTLPVLSFKQAIARASYLSIVFWLRLLEQLLRVVSTQIKLNLHRFVRSVACDWHRKKSASGECLAFLVVDVMRACLHMKRCVLLVQQVRMCRVWRCTSVWISRHTESSSFRRSLAHHLRYLLVAHTGDNMHLLGLFAWSFVRAVNAKTIPCQEISHFDSKSKAQIKKLYFSLRSFDLLGALQFYLRCDIITSGQLSAFSIVLIRILIFAIHFLFYYYFIL